VPDEPLAEAFGAKSTTVHDIVDALARAAEDDRVSGVVARIGAPSLGLAQIQEIRDAVLAFRESGKPTFAWSETFGEFGPGNGGYYLASAFETVFLQPSGDVGLVGLMYETPFVRGTFDKLGIVPRMDHRYEYKNAMNTYTETKFTAPHREALERVMRSQFGQMVRGIAKGRNLSDAEVEALFDKGPYLGQQAVDAHLVDGLAYRDEVISRVKEACGSDASLLYLPKYLERAGRPHSSGKTIALIYGVGGVTRGASEYNILNGPTMG